MVARDGSIHEGEHEAIIDETLWRKVQKKPTDNRTDRKLGRTAAETSLLAGLLFDESGNRLTPSHANKKGRRYRYYVTQGLILGEGKAPGTDIRIPASEIEGVVLTEFEFFLGSSHRLLDALAVPEDDVASRRYLLDRAAEAADQVRDGDRSEIKGIVQACITRIELHKDRVEMFYSPGRLRGWLSGETISSFQPMAPDDLVQISINARLKRRGVESKLIIEGESRGARANLDTTLIRAVAKAHDWNRRLISGEAKSIRALARQLDVTNRYVRKLLPLATLAPDIVDAILEGRQPRDLSLEALVQTAIPLDWEEQRRRLGFGAAGRPAA